MDNTPDGRPGTSNQPRRKPGRPKKRQEPDDQDRVIFEHDAVTVDLDDQSEPEDPEEEAEVQGTPATPAANLVHQAARDLKLKMPEYKSKRGSDPQVHLQAFESWANLRELPRSEWRACFPQTLRGVAQTWYFNYPPESLPTYKATTKAFV